MIIHDSEAPSEEECIKSFGRRIQEKSHHKKKKGILKSASSMTSVVAPTRTIPIESTEKPLPVFLLERKKYLCNLYMRKYNQELLTKVRKGECDPEEYWESIIGRSATIEDTFYKSILQYFYIDTTEQ